MFQGENSRNNMAHGEWVTKAAECIVHHIVFMITSYIATYKNTPTNDKRQIQISGYL